MTPDDREALLASLAQMRTLHVELSERRIGVGVLHLEAAIAALESHLRRDGASLIDELRPGLTVTANSKSRQDAAE